MNLGGMNMSEMKKGAKGGLFFAVLLAVAAGLRVALNLLGARTTVLPEEMLSLELAQNLWQGRGFSLFAAQARCAHPLYPLLLSPFYAIADASARLTALSVFNALLVSSALIPGWLLGRLLLRDRRQLRLFLLFLALAPDAGFALPFSAEALLFPLLLWGFYFFVRYLLKPDSLLFPILLGIWAFLLSLTSEACLPFLLAGLVLFAQPWSSRHVPAGTSAAPSPSSAADAPAAPPVRRTFLPPLACILAFLAAFLVPWGAAQLFFLHDPGALLLPFTGGFLTSPGRVFYFLFAAVMLLYSLGFSWAFFPLALPLTRLRKLPRELRRLLLFGLFYALFTALQSAMIVSVPQEFGKDVPAIHLNALVGAFVPFLLAFFSLPDPVSPPEKKTSFLSLLPWIAAAALLAAPPVLLSIADAPGLYGFWALGQENASLLWLLPVITAVALLIAAFLCHRFGSRALLGFLLPLLGAILILNQYAFLHDLRTQETAAPAHQAEEAALLEQALQSEPGSLLFLQQSAEDPSLRTLSCWLSRDGALLLRPDLLSLAAENTALSLPLSAAPFPCSFQQVTVPEALSLSQVDLVLCPASLASCLDPAEYDNITPAGVTSFTLLRAKNPEVLAIADLLSQPLDEAITFGSSDGSSFLRFPVSGFLAPEEDAAWAAGPEATITLKPADADPDTPLVLRLSWTAANDAVADPLPCQIYAGGMLVSEEPLSASGGTLRVLIPDTAVAWGGSLPLRFVFPSVKAAADGSGPQKAAAFRSLRLSSGKDVLFLPAGLTTVTANAFRGLPARAVYLSEGITKLGSHAFADCSYLTRVYVPASLREIAEDAFSGCSESLTLVGPANSPAKWFAADHNIPYEVE